MTLIRTGHGYESGGYGRCTAFDGITILSQPLGGFSTADRERRVFGSGHIKTTYGSHTVALGESETCPGTFYILLHNGSGREVWQLPYQSQAKTIAALIQTMPEAEQYLLLYWMWSLARGSRDQAINDTGQKWAQAIVEKRIKRQKRGTKISVSIDTNPTMVRAHPIQVPSQPLSDS